MGAIKNYLPHFLYGKSVYQYSDIMLRHLRSDALKTIRKTHLYSKKPVYFASETHERRNHNGVSINATGLSATEITTAKKQHAKDLDIDDRIKLFQNQLKNEYVYRIPLRYFSDIGKINFPTKIDYRIRFF